MTATNVVNITKQIMIELKNIIELLDGNSLDIIVLSSLASSVIYLIRYIKKCQAETRIDLKEMHRSYRKDICELMDRSKAERDEQRASLEKISEESNRVMTKLILTVAELKVMVSARLKA
tara:strand:+ start:60 stop:419 length:360 start_codon:yes stop_codon:yes gene_type:complete